MQNNSLFTIVLIFLPVLCLGQQNYQVTTVDITNFWQAYDNLAGAATKDDSIAIIQQQYIDRASPFFQEFIRIRKFTATEYVEKIGRYPKFWQSVRSRTEDIAHRTGEIDSVYAKFSQVVPGFKPPNVCFAIGCLRTGGTVSGNLILIGAELTAADSTTNKSELSPHLQAVLGTLGDIVAMVAHETVHVLQTGKIRHHLLYASLTEGIADFITEEFLGLNINARLHTYGNQHECEIWQLFQHDLAADPADYSNWLYNGSKMKDRPADLGYFVGYKIAKAYYQQTHDKNRAMEVLLNRRKYKRLFKESSYTGTCHEN